MRRGDDGSLIVMPREMLELFELKPGKRVTADKKKEIAIRREAL